MTDHHVPLVRHLWRGPFTDPELTGLHARAFGHPPQEDGWWDRVRAHSLGWVCARRETVLVGFVNLAWDGGAHAFLLDTAVEPGLQRSGVGTGLVAAAAEGARAARCQWLHVDFEPHLRDFYLGACALRPTHAGLLAL
ncbi:acetyltransferase (GNAT) family protein [Nocardiopsis sp. Huas11]|uniref:GNAT family N-acetyltransferase n=1 Tax=Nocardiopsis sp. Huas11 TaxID=2183912 RepID=UPI000F2B25BC|nr:GNAT family N-acetyltransferase [Nocardiopsis sp. Huas11]RKS08699.1 acetyltransferase (GNAT) family protein [Nocardiopsis sp. Huas11]